ncbi:MAG TPA: acyltransferase [Methylophilus sp.]
MAYSFRTAKRVQQLILLPKRGSAVNADFGYLWRYRERPQTLRRWVIVWGKRCMLAYALVRMLFRANVLRWRGANMGILVSVGPARIGGNLKGLTVGAYSTLGRCEIALHDKVSIGKSVVINDGAILLTASHDLSDARWRHTKGAIDIGDYAWIATNAIVCPGVSIGTGAVVGAGAVVRENVPPYAIAVGNPAVISSRRRTQKLAYCPTLMNAPLEAWVGRNLHRMTPYGMEDSEQSPPA